MKKLALSILLAVFLLGSVGTASAADSGLWTKGFINMCFQYITNLHFQKNGVPGKDGSHGDQNRFATRQRVRMVLEYVKDENLSATLQFEIDQAWGFTKANNMGYASGGRINSDGVNIATKHAYLDWIVPNTALRVRMGVQPLALPWSLPGNNTILNADAAGILLSYKFNDWIGINAFWSRFWDSAYFGDNGTIYGASAVRHDDWDAFGLIIPLTFDGLKITPYGIYSRMGKTVHDVDMGAGSGTRWLYSGADGNDAYNGWWGGISASLTMFDPFFANLDMVYGSLSNNGRHSSMHGWFGGLQIGYKTDYVTPSIIGFYSSGKRGNSHDSRIPYIGSWNGGFGFTPFGMDGDFNIGYDTSFTAGMNGVWALGLKLANISFLQDLSHTINFVYYRGTSKKDQANDNNWNAYSGVMTTKDWAWEVNLENRYNIYENLIAVLEFSYLKPNFDDDIGGRRADYMNEGAFKGALQLQYNF